MHQQASKPRKYKLNDPLSVAARAMPEASGIYRLRNVLTDDSYIGSSENIRIRVMSHVHNIRSTRAAVTPLLRNARCCGVAAFVPEVLELCDVQLLGVREQFHIRTRRPTLNINPIAVRTRGAAHKANNSPRLVEFPETPGLVRWCPSIQQAIDKLVAEGESPMNAVAVALDSEILARRIAARAGMEP